MNPSEEFLRHADDCQRMAKFTRDPTSKETWSRMAERWIRCAEVFESQRGRKAGETVSSRRRRHAALTQRPLRAVRNSWSHIGKAPALFGPFLCDLGARGCA